MPVVKNPDQEAHLFEGESAIAIGVTGPIGAVGATGPTGPTGIDHRPRRRKTIAAPPLLHLARPGDLITAQYINDLVLAVQNLQARVDDLEQIYDSSYRETWGAMAR